MFAVAAFLFVGCNDYLDKSPDSELDVDIDSEEKIAELLTGAYPEASYIPFLEPRTDNVEERVNGIHSRLNEAMFFWEDYDQEDLDTPLNYWNACYKGIAQANKALELLSRYPKKRTGESLVRRGVPAKGLPAFHVGQYLVGTLRRKSDRSGYPLHHKT